MSDEVKKQEELKQQQYLTNLKKQYDQEVVNFQLKFLDSLHKEFQRFSTQNQMPVSHTASEEFHIKRYDLKVKGKVTTIEYGAFNCRLMSSAAIMNKFFIKVYGDLWIVDIGERKISMPPIHPKMFLKFPHKAKTIEDKITNMLMKIDYNRKKKRMFKYYCEKENGIEMKYHPREEVKFSEMITDIL